MKETHSLAEKYLLFFYFLQGVRQIFKSKQIIVYLIVLLVFLKCTQYMTFNGVEVFTILFIILSILYVLCNSMFFKNISIRRKLKKIKFCNKMKEYPCLLDISKEKNKNCATFKSKGISSENWEENTALLENVLNITISRITLRNNQDEISIYYTKGIFDYSRTREMNDSLMLCEEYFDEIVLGENGEGIISMSFRDIPHMLIGGSSGSGKTKLVKLILHQCMYMNYEIYLVDFKWGVDFSNYFKKGCHFIKDINSLLECLSQIHKTMIERLILLDEAGYSNIDEFNSDIFSDCDDMRRIILVIDEFADILGNKSVSKDKKIILEQIEDMLTEISRKGRAAGVHMIVSTQRPDAVVLPSAIKSNFTYRIAGECDDNLSRIILDNGNANSMIPKDTKGVFLDSNGRLFKGFLLVE